jgi:VIT1/CCC1 family predicted Fe2+/Mn2+ transporter
MRNVCSVSNIGPLTDVHCDVANHVLTGMLSGLLEHALVQGRSICPKDTPMHSHRRHAEWHRTDRIGWLRATVLGANDGIVSTASLVLGVAAASASRDSVLLTGVAGLVAGAMSMAAGEYVSVHSQADTESADLSRERSELEASPAAEERELGAIYVARGLEPALAQQVASQLMSHDALGAHARDELGISATMSARRPPALPSARRCHWPWPLSPRSLR